MFKYSLLNLLFLIPVFIFAYSNFTKNRSITGYLIAILVGLTIIFDNLIIMSGIVTYNADNILSINIGYAPIEDFAYTVAAALLLPAIWERRKRDA